MEKGNFDSGIFFSTKSQPVGEKLFRNGSISSPHLKKKKSDLCSFKLIGLYMASANMHTGHGRKLLLQDRKVYTMTKHDRARYQGRTRQDMK